jgi:hypothetical protein
MKLLNTLTKRYADTREMIMRFIKRDVSERLQVMSESLFPHHVQTKERTEMPSPEGKRLIVTL